MDDWEGKGLHLALHQDASLPLVLAVATAHSHVLASALAVAHAGPGRLLHTAHAKLSMPDLEGWLHACAATDRMPT